MTHSVPAFLTHSAAHSSLPNLVVARHNHLDIYEIVSKDTASEKVEYRLELIVTRRLYGVIESLTVLKKPRSSSQDTREALLLTFRDAKLSVLRWEDDIWDLQASSLHYFESDVSLKAGRVCFPCPPCSLADPVGRCASVIMFRHQIAILPATESLESDAYGIFDDDNESLKEASEQNGKQCVATVGNSYIDNLGAAGVRDIRDACFLYGTSEPTLVCLYEGEPTWTGNMHVKRDTCCLAAMSINMADKRHPKVWEALGVPSDAYKVSATPGGGLLVFSGTSILYYNQSHRSGIVLHSEGISCAENPPALTFDPSLEPPSESAKKYAENYGADLFPAATSATLSFCDTQFSSWDIDCSCASIAWLEDSLALISFRYGQMITLEVMKEVGGSRKLVPRKIASGPQPMSMSYLGSGLVFIGSRGGDSLLFSCQREEVVKHGNMKKKQKIEEPSGQQDEDIYEDYLEDLIPIYTDVGDEKVSSEVKIHVHDSITSLGAMRKLINFPAENDKTCQRFLGCCGTSDNGALAIIQKGILPDVITSIPLPGLKRIFSIESSSNLAESYLVLGFEGNTKVLSASGDLKEVTEQVQFAHNVTTLSAGRLASGFEYQVYANGMRLMTGGNLVHEVFASDLHCFQGCLIQRAHALEDSILLLLSDGSSHVFTAEDRKLSLVGRVPSTFQGRMVKITAACLYRDADNWLASSLKETGELFVWACYANGDVMIWSISNIISGSKFPLWRSNSMSSGVDVAFPIAGGEASLVPEEGEDTKRIIDIKASFFRCSKNPIVVVLEASGRVYCYKVFSNQKSVQNLPRLKRIKIPLSLTTNWTGGEIFSFDRIGEHLSYSGFFLTGKIPMWLIVSNGRLFAHEAHSVLSEGVCSFSPFNNESCPHGFLAVNDKNDSLIVANFPPRQTLDAPWPRRKLSIKAVPWDCTYYPEAKLIALLASSPAPHRAFLPEDGESELQAAYSYSLAGVEGLRTNLSEKHEIRLVTPSSWSVVWKHNLLPGERGACIQAVHLKEFESQATIPLIAVGTSFSAGEDYPCSGRVILVEVTKDDNHTWTGRVVYSREFKGPVTNITVVEGYLLLSTGNRIETCILKSQKPASETGMQVFSLQRSAFYEGPSLITSLTVVKNFILLGDAQHSVHFLRYKDQGKQIMLLSKDFGQACAKACQFVIAGSSLHVVMADGEGNLWSFTYAPNDPQSWKGQKLSNWGAIHVGKGISGMLRTPMTHQLLNADTGFLTYEMAKIKQGVLCTSDMGGLYVMVPFTEAEISHVSVKTKEATKALASAAASCAGLNPLAFRRRYQKSLVSLMGAKSFDPPLAFLEQGIVDGDLLNEYLHLPVALQSRLASKLEMEKDLLYSICSMINGIRPSK